MLTNAEIWDLCFDSAIVERGRRVAADLRTRRTRLDHQAAFFPDDLEALAATVRAALEREAYNERHARVMVMTAAFMRERAERARRRPTLEGALFGAGLVDGFGRATVRA